MFHYCKQPHALALRKTVSQVRVRNSSLYNHISRKMGDCCRHSDITVHGQTVTAWFLQTVFRWSVRDRKYRRPLRTCVCVSVLGRGIARQDVIACSSRENFGLRTQPLLCFRGKPRKSVYRITQECRLPVDHKHHMWAARRSPMISVAVVHEVLPVNNLEWVMM